MRGEEKKWRKGDKIEGKGIGYRGEQCKRCGGDGGMWEGRVPEEGG